MTFHTDMGSCHLILGPMFSGKTTHLIKELTTFADIGMKVLYINHTDDNRITTFKIKNITTHHSSVKRFSDKITTLSVKNLSDLKIEEYDVIGIDEGQFFPFLVNAVRDWVIQKNKIVWVASLNADFKIQPFGKVHNLICLADTILKLKAKCMKCIHQTEPYRRICMVDASFTAKIEGSNTQKEIGGKEKYIAVCMKCYKEYTSSLDFY